MIPIGPIVGGITLGCLYMLIAMGFSLTYSVMGIVNFVHGAFIVIGSYLLFSFFYQCGVNPVLSIVVTTVALFFIGMGFEELIIRPLRESHLATLMITAAIAVLLGHLLMVIWGPANLTVPSFIYAAIDVGGVKIPVGQIISAFVSILILSVFWLFLMKTKSGKAVRMVAEDVELAILSGINAEKIYRLTFGIAAACAACGGALLAPIFGVSSPMEWLYLMKAFAIVILGGMGSLKGTALASLILGITEWLFAYYVSPAHRDVVSLIFILITLLCRPSGLLGRTIEHA